MRLAEQEYYPQTMMWRLLSINSLYGVKTTFIVHDLRRTFATTVENLDLPAYALKRLLNHKMTHDVTAGYIMRDVERFTGHCQIQSELLHLNSYLGKTPR